MRLRSELFRLHQRDDQLLLALVVCMADLNAATGVHVDDLAAWLDEHAGQRTGHPSVSDLWSSYASIQGDLRQLRTRGLARGNRLDQDDTANTWRPTERGLQHLGARRLFNAA